MTQPETVDHPYIMEHCEEGERLVRKTRKERVQAQACWAGLQPGMRVLDVGCGAGLTTAILAEIAGPEGKVIGIDSSPERIESALRGYPGSEFRLQEIYESLDELGQFDFIWVRFFLEYHRRKAEEILGRVASLLSSGGILCAADLDYNSMTHYPVEPDFQAAVEGLVAHLQEHADWDPYLGRKLFTWFHDLGFEDIDLRMEPHHLILGAMNPTDEFNWLTKLKVAAGNSGYAFPELQGGAAEFFSRAEKLFADPRHLTYTPLFICRGVKPAVR